MNTTSHVALNGLERRKMLEMLPRLVPNDGLVILRLGPVLGLDDEPVVRPCHDLHLALHHLLQHQPRLGLVIVHLDGELCSLPHVRVAQVLYRLPPPARWPPWGNLGSRDFEEEEDGGGGGGGDGEDEESQSHFRRFLAPLFEVVTDAYLDGI
ncbi:hypothetical protein BT93_E2775 [Corymbia citriodora subsp. variegata]|nr:hypothetical protein BT93_E2775 [Corymbia citriodora subsp. variegata]